MLCCELNLPNPFGWRIKGIGKCVELVDGLSKIMQLPQTSEGAAEMTVMSRSYYDSFSEKECSDLQIFYSRKAVRLFHNGHFKKWLMVLSEDILNDRDIRIVLMWLMLRPFYLHCLSNGGLPVHASSASLNEQGIIVAAAGDTGKTTTVRRLPEPWKEHGDDTALLLPDNDGFRFYPLPTWSEFIYGRSKSASWNVEKGTNLAGIFFLEQSEQDKAERISLPQSIMSLYESSMEALGGLEKDMSNKLRVKIFETTVSIAESIPSFALHATINGRVWESIESKIILNVNS